MECMKRKHKARGAKPGFRPPRGRKMRPMKKLFPALLALFALFFGTSAFADTNQECLKCHASGTKGSSLHMSAEQFKASVHGQEVTCLECHQNAANETHQTQPGSGRVDCGQCHDEQNRHGWDAQSGTRPQCYSCHTRHGMLAPDNPASSVNAANLTATCSSCHATQCGQAALLPWLASVQIRIHGKQDLGCAYDETDCLGCHQGRASHGQSEVLNSRNCQRCHLTTDGRSALLGSIHPRSDAKGHAVSWLSGTVYVIAIVLMLLGGLGFYARRLSARSTNGTRKK
jgi:hypothetical protein